MNDRESANGHEDHHMMEYVTVRIWIASVQTVSLRPANDHVKRLDLIAEFVAHIGEDPDTIVSSARGDSKAKNRYLGSLRRWASALPGSDRHRHDAENMIRGFFMRNGFRVVARPYADVYRRAGSE
jgi:hypothetical protein